MDKVIRIDPYNFNVSLDIKDLNLISKNIINSKFDPLEDLVEFFCYDLNNNILLAEYNFQDYNVENDIIKKIYLDPINILKKYGFNKGDLNVIFSFIKNELGSSFNLPFYIDEISPSRTELRLKSLNINNLEDQYNLFKQKINNSDEINEIYLNFGNNTKNIITNIIYDNNSILIKLYEPLDSLFEEKNECYIVSKVSDELAYNVKFSQISDFKDNIIYIKNANTNLNVKNNFNNSTDYQNYQNITSNIISGSLFQLNNLISQSSNNNLSIDYTNYNTFVHFSSIKQRLLNFYNKISSLELYENEKSILFNITGSTSQSLEISSSLNVLNNKINDIISNLDGYEYYLYYESNSYSWPKSNNTFPYSLYSTGSIEVINWLGSDDYNSIYYGGQLFSASIFDNQNQNNLINLIPSFILEDEENNNYVLFINMIGHFFDQIWIYLNNITQKLKADNRFNHGVSNLLIADVIQSLGLNIHTNNYSLVNLYSALIGVDPSGSYYLPTGSDYINNFININSGSLYKPYTIDSINKEIYKRLYHNLAFILKKKGTIQGLRELGNIYGIPNTILHINEAESYNQIENIDYGKNIFNYAYYSNLTSSNEIRVPFSLPNSNTQRPESITFRFKPNNPFSSSYSQSLLRFSQFGPDLSVPKMAITVEFTGSLITGSYSGSVTSSYNSWGHVNFYLSGSSLYTASIFAPIYNGDWWSLLINKENQGISIYLKNKKPNIHYNELDYQLSSSIITNDTGSWLNPGNDSTKIGIKLGGGGYSIGSKTYTNFQGYLQELRYYKTKIEEEVFNSFVLNPLSIESNEISGSFDSYNNLTFRATLGSDLYVGSLLRSASLNYDSGCFDLRSIHPATTGSARFDSFISNSILLSNNRYLLPSTASLGISWSFEPNIESIFIKEPIAGIKNRVTDKIKIDNNLFYGNTLSRNKRIEQEYIFSGSYNNTNYIEAAFSPQNEINDDISDQLGDFNIGEYIGNAADTSSLTYYPNLNKIRDNYFKKYIHNYNVWDYIRLIKFYDNSIFKIVRDFIPIKSSLGTGILIKQHILERNRHRLVSITNTSSLAQKYYKDITLTSSIKSYSSLSEGQRIFNSSNDYESFPLELVYGGTGGIFPDIKLIQSNSLYNITQSWLGINKTLIGDIEYNQNTHDEFYNGELSGSNKQVVTQSLNLDTFLDISTKEIYYSPYLFKTSNVSFEYFFNENTIPSQGEIYLLYDIGSNIATYLSTTK